MNKLVFYLPAAITLTLSALCLAATQAFAFETSLFPSCIAPQDTIIAQYDLGIYFTPPSEAGSSGEIQSAQACTQRASE